MKRVAILFVVASLAGCAASDSGASGSTTAETIPATPTVETTQAKPTTTAATAGVTGESTTTSIVMDSPTREEPPHLLVADDEGVRVLADGEVVQEFVEQAPVALALPDLAGGVVFQRTAEGSPIEWVARPGDEPIVLIQGKAWLEDVAAFDGGIHVVYRTVIEDPAAGCAENDDECRWLATEHHLNTYDLDTGLETDLGIVAHFESSWTHFILGHGRMVVLKAKYGEPDACGAVWERSQLTDIAHPTAIIGEAGPFFRRCDFGPSSRDAGGTLRASLAPDDSTVAYVETAMQEEGGATTFVVIDSATIAELRRVTLEPSFDPAWMDWDGVHAVVGDWEGTTRLLIGPDDTITDLGALATAASRLSLWQEST
ncbi:MAG: hypothetical protein OEX04_08755 [Acidimicrobiia bacterium]|nr:hypothetical protein [Acidimicrobiia bacterium]MDH4307558.1 hypothetical protein [Acidimicrobiia bacterium]